MTDTEILDYIEAHLGPANTGGPATASVKLASKITHNKLNGHRNSSDYVLYRFGGGRWRPSLRAAIEDYRTLIRTPEVWR